MKERPILFSGPMVRAILEGRKTQTRRVVKPQPEPVSPFAPSALPGDWTWHRGGCSYTVSNSPHGPADIADDCPYGVPGDRLWLREAVYIAPPDFGDPDLCNATDNKGRRRVVGYAASMDFDSVRCAIEYGVKKTPSIHMPRWACRIVLEVVSVRVERVQAISEADSIAEGVAAVPFNAAVVPMPEMIGKPYVMTTTARDIFKLVWEPINGKGSWAANPWVWVVEFRRVES